MACETNDIKVGGIIEQLCDEGFDGITGAVITLLNEEGSTGVTWWVYSHEITTQVLTYSFQCIY